jgi:catechol 2,3-dioxygenase-like lactoylglutathione lyase family enzyme
MLARRPAIGETMITGMHMVIYTSNPDADRAFFRDVLGFPSVDAGGGWLIFAAPPAEIACHPADNNDKHEIYLLCDDLHAEIVRLGEKKIRCDSVATAAWGLKTMIHLPGGGHLGLYQPRHVRPPA